MRFVGRESKLNEIQAHPDMNAAGRVRFPIRTRLVLLVLALALPFAGYSIFSSIEEARIERAHAAAQMLGTAQITAARLDDHINDIRSILQVLSAAVSVDPAKTADNDALLRSLIGNIPTHIHNLSVWTAAGENVGTLDARLRQNGAAAATSRQFFKEALAGGGMSAEAPLDSLASGERISAFGLPIRREGRVIGVVAAAARLDALQSLLSSGTDLPPGAVMTITDPRGVVLARSLDPELWVGKTLKGGSAAGTDPEPGLGADGVRDGPSADGIERIAGFTTARAAPWRVYVGVPRDQALAPVYARLRNHLFTAGLMLLAGLLLAAFVGEGIASPLRKLANDAVQFGTGNLAHRSRSHDSGEVGVLTRTLNQMAEQLQERARDVLSTQEQLRQVTDNLPALISYLDAEERFRFANRVYATWLGQDPGELLGKSLVDLYGREAYDGFKVNIQQALGGSRVSYERELSTLQGPRHVEVTAVPDVDKSGRVAGLFVMMSDVTARRDAEAALLQSEQRLRMVADNIPALVSYVDRDERYRFVNAHLGSVFDIDSQGLLGRTLREAGGKKLYAEIAPYVAAALRGEETVFEGVWTIKDRSYHYQSTYIPDVDDQGTVRGFYAMTFDISALKETQRRLDMLARVDTLTGLPNRRQFDERLRDAMGRTRRAQTALAVMFLDIDHFKNINDTLGHGAGDLVLKEFGIRLRHQVRATDIVARLAGDEFVVLVEGIRDIEELKALAAKIVQAVRSPLVLESRSVTVTTSVGVATYDGGEQAPAELLAAADRALYAAKRQGRNRFCLALQGSAEIHELAAARVSTDADRTRADLR